MDEPAPEHLVDAEAARAALDAATEAAKARFKTSVSGGRPNQAQIDAVNMLSEIVVELAAYIDVLVPDGRNKSLALTALEDAHMRANRGIFQDGAR